MTLRRKIGLLKWRLLDDLPYHLLKRKGEQQRKILREEVVKLPPLSETTNDGAEIHMLCGESQLDMAIWASWSLMRFLKGSSLYIHSDGTLNENQVKQWRSIIPNLTLITKEEGDRSVEQLLGAQYPKLLEWRQAQFYGVKFLDFHLFGLRDRIVALDSDVLFFKKPYELLAGLEQARTPFLWHEDNRTSYLTSTRALQECIDLLVPERVCAGLLLTKRWEPDDLEFFEEVLIKMQSFSLPICHDWAEQTMYAIAGCRHRQTSALSEKHSVYFGKTLESSVMRHYTGVSKLRPRFYLEGIPRLLHEMNSARTLPNFSF